jgi:2-polyprenyl-3-methyl-5-hydroxy-6-metoxy-1,4-benzoquinol methylase
VFFKGEAVMNDQQRRDYHAAKDFWNTAFHMDEAARQQAETSFDENGWKNRAPSEKLLHAAENLGQCEKVLDYGCGSGWGAVIAAKSGCHNVTAVDVSANAVESAKFYAKLYGGVISAVFYHVYSLA